MRTIASASLFVLLLPASFAGAQSAADLDSRVAKIVESVSEERLTEILKKLEGFGTRHTLSNPDTPGRGVGAARQWILEEMQRSSPRLQVSFDTYQVPKQGERMPRDFELRNVMAVLPGKSPRRLYVSGHYDSVARRPRAPGAPAVTRGPEAPTVARASNSPAQRAADARPAGAADARPAAADPRGANGADGTGPDAPAQSASGGFDWTVTDNPAPGVNDDGSGTALTMELARVFGQSGIEFDATLVFIAFAGEEEGLVGARQHAQKAATEKWPIEAVLNNDIVGNIEGGNGVVDSSSVRIFSDGPEDSPSRQLARAIKRQASRYVPGHEVRLMARQDRFGRGGDHSAFNQKGFAAVRFTESKENYGRQHTDKDTFAGVSPPYLAKNAKVNAAALATLALAPPAPVIQNERGRPSIGRQPSGYDANLRWRAVPGAVGYRVFWREAWAPDWQHERTVGNVTELVLPGVSIDDYVFGVAALSADGNESLVSAYVNPARSDDARGQVGTE